MTEPELNTRLQTITPPDEAARAAAPAAVRPSIAHLLTTPVRTR